MPARGRGSKKRKGRREEKERKEGRSETQARTSEPNTTGKRRQKEKRFWRWNRTPSSVTCPIHHRSSPPESQRSREPGARFGLREGAGKMHCVPSLSLAVALSSPFRLKRWAERQAKLRIWRTRIMTDANVHIGVIDLWQLLLPSVVEDLRHCDPGKYLASMLACLATEPFNPVLIGFPISSPVCPVEEIIVKKGRHSNHEETKGIIKCTRGQFHRNSLEMDPRIPKSVEKRCGRGRFG